MEIRSLKDCLKFYKSTNRDMRIEVAVSSFASSEILAELAKDEDPFVRLHVAGNPNTHSLVLAELAKDASYDVRESVAENPETPSYILNDLAEDNFLDVVCNAIYNPNYNSKYKNDLICAESSDNPDFLSKLANHEYFVVRRLVAHNESTPSEVLIKLAEDSNHYVKTEVASNYEHMPDKAAFMLLSDDDSDVRETVYDFLSDWPWFPSFEFDDLETLLLLVKALLMNKSFNEAYYDYISEELLRKINSLLLRF